jgi:hypothetical protein
MNEVFYIIIQKKRGNVNPSYVTQARHQFFNWKLETRREFPPSAPLAFLGNKKPYRVIFDSTSTFKVSP